jgi:hypothetical protein
VARTHRDQAISVLSPVGSRPDWRRRPEGLSIKRSHGAPRPQTAPPGISTALSTPTRSTPLRPRSCPDSCEISGSTSSDRRSGPARHVQAAGRALRAGTDGLITRRRDNTNRRIHVVELTGTGEEAFLRLRRAAQTFDKQLREGTTLSPRIIQRRGPPAWLRRSCPAVGVNRKDRDQPGATRSTMSPRRRSSHAAT